MIGAMQDFNFQFGVGSYIRIGLDFTGQRTQDGTLADYRLEFGEKIESFAPSLSPSDIKFYVNGLERSEGVPYYNSTPYFIIPKGTRFITIELRTDGPFLEQISLQRGASTLYRLIDLYYNPQAGSWISQASMPKISTLEVSDNSGLKLINRYGLYGMRNVNTVILPASIQQISQEAMGYMNPYATLICKAKTPPSTNGGVLFEPHNGYLPPYDYATLYVPKGCAAIYRQQTIDGVANDWSRFQNILELDY